MEDQPIVAAPAAPLPPTKDDVRLAARTQTEFEASRAIFNFNKHALVQAMRVVGITSVAVTYNGCGDSGQTDEACFEPTAATDGAHQVSVAHLQHRWNVERGCSERYVEFVEMEIIDVAGSLCDLAITLMGHDGYENNDGGAGTFTLQAADGSAELEHSDYYTESDTTTHAL
jgi:hypothetical protein